MHFLRKISCSRRIIVSNFIKNIRKMCDTNSLPDDLKQKSQPQPKTLEKGYRNVQTQHCIESEVENIMLFKEMNNSKLEFSSSTEDVVWFEDVSESKVVDNSTVSQTLEKETKEVDISTTTKSSEVDGTKRKCSDSVPTPVSKKKRQKLAYLSKNRPGFGEDRYNETSYYFENGLRKVYPYYFTFTTFTKGRWIGENVLDVFIREFRAHPGKEYEKAITTGSLTINGETVPIDYKLQHNDLLSNTVHRHELPVLGQKIDIIHLDSDICVINKPASIPVHPCGRYRHNTVLFILAKEYNLKELKPIHRLDRLTSGLLIMCRNLQKAREMESYISSRQVEKQYVCRVEGEFPDDPIVCNEPIDAISHKIGVCKVSPKGKDCSTTFEKIHYNSKTNTSVVRCKPRTGRLHQIRVHLQYLGFPIVNDPLYNHEVFGPLKGKAGDFGGQTDEELIANLINVHNAENWLGIDGDPDLRVFKSLVEKDDETSGTKKSTPIKSLVLNSNSEITKPLTANEKSVQTMHEAPDLELNPDKVSIDENCFDCKLKFKDPKPHDLVMYLHAFSYSGPNWKYETPMPAWADENFE